MPEALIVDALRTPIGRYGGVLADVRPDDLAALVVERAVAHNGIDPEAIDDVVMGSANGSGEEKRNVARMAAPLASPVCVYHHHVVDRLGARSEEQKNRLQLPQYIASRL